MKTLRYDNIGETLYSETLGNGLTVLVLPKPGFTKSYAMFATDYGGADRRYMLSGKWTDTPAGVAHFLEHKMFDTPDGGNALTVLSANGASPNAFTGSAMTAYYFESTSGFEENLRMLLDFVSVPYFTDDSVQKEQGIIGQEIRMIEDSPDFVVYMNALKCLYEHNPISESVAGSIESIARITAQTLYDCHRVFYNPSNMVLCVVGDVDAQAVVDIARRALPAEPGEAPQRDYGPNEGLFPVTKRICKAMAVSLPQFVIASKVQPADKGPGTLRQSLAASLAMKYLLGTSSPFYAGLYSSGDVTGPFDYELDRSGGVSTVLISGEGPDPDSVLSKLSAEVSSVVENGVDKERFERLRKAYFGASLRSLSSFEGLCQSLAESHFAGCCAMDRYALINDIGTDEILGFIAENLAAEKLAISIVEPVK